MLPRRHLFPNASPPRFVFPLASFVQHPAMHEEMMQALELQQQRFDEQQAVERAQWDRFTLMRQDSRRLSRERHEAERRLLQQGAAEMHEQLRRSQLLLGVHEEIRSLRTRRLCQDAADSLQERNALARQVSILGEELRSAERELEERHIALSSPSPRKDVLAAGVAVGAAAVVVMAVLWRAGGR